MQRLLTLLCVGAVLASEITPAAELTVAVASNFLDTATTVAAQFTDDTGIPVRLVAGSTGKLYAQIENGAPFDVFLAADQLRPQLLAERGFAVDATRVSYAIGSLRLVSFDEALTDDDCLLALQEGRFRRIAIANPKTAPYGQAAQSFLTKHGLMPNNRSQVVYGANITQALQFVATGNATLGFVAASQLRGDLGKRASCNSALPHDAATEIVQQGAVIAASTHRDAATSFMQYLVAPKAQRYVLDDGYQVGD